MKIPPATRSHDSPSPEKAQPAQSKHDPLMAVSKSFEAVFINQMISAMRKTVTKGGFIPESQAEKVYQSMLDYEHAQKMADSGEIGLSKLIYEHLLRTQIRR